VQDEVGERKLALHVSGEAVGNQFLFAKTTLTSSLYHHPKVRAADSTFRAILERVVQDGSDVNGRVVKSPVDFLRMTDSDFSIHSFVSEDDECIRLVKRLRNRDLLVSAAEIGTSAVEVDPSGTEPSDLWDLRLGKNLWENSTKVKTGRSLAGQLIEDHGVSAAHSDIWVDFPYMVKLSALPLTDGQTLDHTFASFPSDAWSQQYVKYLYRGYVFSPASTVESAVRGFTSIAETQYSTRFKAPIEQTLSPYRAP
jgi:hypothetical protein